MELILDNKNTSSHRVLNVSGSTLLVLAGELTPGIRSIAEKYKLATVLIKHLPETDKLYICLGITNTGYYLVRPDMYIELRSANSETEALSRYLHRKFIVH